MLTRKDLNTAIINFKKSLLDQGIEVPYLWLFGSYAKGCAKMYSDIDLAVFSPQFVDNPLENNKYIYKATRIPLLEIHFFTMQDYEENPFVQEIAQHKIEF